MRLRDSVSALLLAKEDLMKYIKDIRKYVRNGSILPVFVTEESVHEYYCLFKVNAWLTQTDINILLESTVTIN